MKGYLVRTPPPVGLGFKGNEFKGNEFKGNAPPALVRWDEATRTTRLTLPFAPALSHVHTLLVQVCGLNAVGFCAQRRVLTGKRCCARSGRTTLHVEVSLCGRRITFRWVQVQNWDHYLQCLDGFLALSSAAAISEAPRSDGPS